LSATECLVRARHARTERGSATLDGCRFGALVELETIAGEHREIRISREATVGPG
jgi:hypothetical protein